MTAPLRLRTAASAGALFLAAAAIALPADARPPADPRAVVLRTLAAERAAASRGRLRSDPRLARIAENFASDLSRRNYFGHFTPERVGPFDRMRRAGYRFRYAGENVGFGANVERAELVIWNDRAHRAEILKPAYRRAGIGVAPFRGGVVLVEDFSD
jgi:uncharacterized protein YkwD